MRSRPDLNPVGTLHFSSTSSKAHLSRQHQAGRAVKLSAGVYVLDATLPPSDLARRHLWDIVAHFWPGAVLCDRSALNGGSGDWVFVCHPDPPRAADLRLPGVTVTCRIGAGPLPGDRGWPGNLFMSGVARGLVENADTSGRPAKARPHRSLGLEAVGDVIDGLAGAGRPGQVMAALTELDLIRGSFEPARVERVRALLSAALGTADDVQIGSARLAARVAGRPYDGARSDLFERFRVELDSLAPSVRPVLGPESRRGWLTFFEAYFSNYIEGTVFSVEEARAIAIDDRLPADRPADAHDVSATYRIVNDPQLMSEVPTDPDTFLDLLQARHRVLMAGRPEKRPGEFKARQNYAGGTTFVSPEQLVGTLRAGWQFIDGLVDPFHRAVMMMFVVSECHPFDDGNGRLARIMTNAELAFHGQHRVIVATSFRSNYLAALAGATNGNSIKALASVLDFTRSWVAAVDWSDWARCNNQLEESNAFLDSAVAERTGQRLRLPD